jgi:uncharacterized cysteine cluster protein YcgN (CxxCxxCC family)
MCVVCRKLAKLVTRQEALVTFHGQCCLAQIAFEDSSEVHVKIFSMSSIDAKDRITNSGEVG